MKTLGIRPIRHYRRVGDKLVIMGSENLDLQITSAEMSEVTELAAKVHLKVPLDKEVVHELATALKLFRATTHAVLPPELEAHQQALNRVEKNVEELLQDLPRLIEFHRDLRFTRAAASAEMFKTLLAAVQYLKVSQASWGSGPSPRRNAALWHDDAIYLSFLLSTAAVRAKTRLSFTKIEAPGVKFIHEALSRAGIEHGGPAAIAQAMARYNKDRRQVRELSTTESEKSLAISPPEGV
jgi:phytoene dehydrogenase-like protein